MNSPAYALKRAAEAVVNQIHTALPGRVERYDHTRQEADVKPLLRRRYKDDTVLDLPVVPSVPVVWPRGNDSSLTMPLKAGDGVLLVFAERAIDKWLSEGGNVTPNDPRKYDLTDAVAIPGLYPFNVAGKAPNNDDVTLIYGDRSFTLKKNGDIEVSGGNKIVVRANGDIEIGQESLKKLVNENLQSLYNNHVHNFVDITYPAGTPTPTPIIAYTGKAASATGAGGITVGSNPAVPPSGLLGDTLGATHLTTKVKAQ